MYMYNMYINIYWGRMKIEDITVIVLIFMDIYACDSKTVRAFLCFFCVFQCGVGWAHNVYIIALTHTHKHRHTHTHSMLVDVLSLSHTHTHHVTLADVQLHARTHVMLRYWTFS